MNPMVGKELRQRMREKRGWVLPSVYLLVLGGVIALAYYFTVAQEQRYGRDIQGAEIGVTIFAVVTFTQLTLLLLLAPVFSAGAITIEKEQRTLSGLLTSLLTIWQIWWGKFVSSLLFLMLLALSALPVLSMSFAFGGIGPRQLLVAVVTTLIILAVVSAIGLYCSSFFKRSIHATAVTYGILIALTVLTLVCYAIIQSYMESKYGTAASPDNNHWLLAPLYLNPYFLVGMAFFSEKEWYPDWYISAGAFALIGCLAILFALRNLRKGGEQV